MKNIKNFLIFLTILFSGIECLSRDPALLHVGEKAATILASAVTDATETLAPVLVDTAKGIGVDAITVLADSNVKVAQLLASASVDAARGVGADAAIAIANSNLAIAKEVMPYVGPVMVAATVVAGVGVAAYSVTQLQPIAKDTYYFIYPTEEQKASESKAGEIVEYIAARVKLRKCFMGSKPKDERNSFGRPIACEEIARMFVACGGKKEVTEMTADFVEYWV